MKTKRISIKQIIIILLGAVIAFIFSPIASFSLNPVGIICMTLGVGVIFAGIFERRLTELLKKAWRKKSGKVCISAVSLILAATFIYGAAATVLIMSKAKAFSENTAPQNTTAIVLGCSVKGDKPSPMLQKRINAAYDYLIKNPQAQCILSGGKGNGENLSEAEAMFNSLKEKGIPEDRMLLEDKSTSTSENLEFSKNIIEKESLGDEVVIITTDFHQYRASLIAKDNGLISYAVSAKSGTFSLPTFLVREWFTLLGYLVLGR